MLVKCDYFYVDKSVYIIIKLFQEFSKIPNFPENSRHEKMTFSKFKISQDRGGSRIYSPVIHTRQKPIFTNSWILHNAKDF